MVAFVFVTGNANKLKEVEAILASGRSDIYVTSHAVDGGIFSLEGRCPGLMPSPGGAGQHTGRCESQGDCCGGEGRHSF